MKSNKIIYLFSLVFLITTNIQAKVITINGIRNFTIDQNTIITIDGIPGDESLFEIVGTGGFKTHFRVADDVNPNISMGTLSEIHLISDIKGPVTSINPFTIFDQPVFATGDTFLENLNDVTDLIIGDLTTVSGTINSQDNSIQLTRIELKPTIDEWKLRGFAKNITASNFTIGGLNIDLNGIVATDCPMGFINDVFVSIKATPDANYIAGGTLTTLTSIECQLPDIDEDSNDFVPVVIEGIVSKIVDLVTFKINNLTIFIDTDTNFDNGEAEHIDVGTKLEVQGILDTDNRLITAGTIRFIDHRVKIKAPVTPADIILNESIEILGQQIQMSPETIDDDELFTNGLNTPRQIEVRGFIDSQGNIYAQRVRDKGSPDSQDVTLRGDVNAINQPMITVNGVLIDASNSQFELNEGPATIAEFFAQLQVGMQLSIDNASYDAVTQQLSLGEIEIAEQETEDDPDNSNNGTPKLLSENLKEIVGTGGIGLATITGNEVIFSSGFE